MHEIDGSLKRLQTDYVYLYIINRWDYDHLIKSKKLRYLGYSSIFLYQLLKANMIEREHGQAEFISIQNHYYLNYREEERNGFIY